MTLESQYLQDGEFQDYTPAVAVTGGEVIQLADGRAGVAVRDIAAGVQDALKVRGIVEVLKTAAIVLLDGGRVYWDVSAGKAHYRPELGTADFFLGSVVGDAAASATTVKVRLNVMPHYLIDNRSGLWTTEATNGEGVTALSGGGSKLSFDAVAEAAQAALYSERSVPVASNPIMEGRVAIFDKGDDVSLDIDFGLANASHATDLESVANLVTVHLDGNSLNINVMSDDGTTDVAAVDTTKDAVDDTYFEFWIDVRNPSNVGVYINGVYAVPDGTTLTLAAATNALKALVMIEKTSNDTLADVRVDFLKVRTAD